MVSLPFVLCLRILRDTHSLIVTHLQALLDREFVDFVACQHHHHGRNRPSPR